MANYNVAANMPTSAMHLVGHLEPNLQTWAISRLHLMLAMSQKCQQACKPKRLFPNPVLLQYVLRTFKLSLSIWKFITHPGTHVRRFHLIVQVYMTSFHCSATTLAGHVQLTMYTAFCACNTLTQAWGSTTSTCCPGAGRAGSCAISQSNQQESFQALCEGVAEEG